MLNLTPEKDEAASGSRVRAFGGRYRLSDIDDCVRLVLDSRPHRQRQEAMLAVIERTPGAPTREEVLKEMKGKQG